MRSSYGEGELVLDARRVGRFRLLSVEPWPALGPLLRVTIGCQLLDVPAGHQGPGIAGYELVDLSGELRVGENGPVVGQLSWAGERLRVVSASHENEAFVALHCPLDFGRLERLEELRAGKSLKVGVALWPRLQHEDRPFHAKAAPFPATIPAEVWFHVLNKLRGEHGELLEVRFHHAYADRFRAVLGELKEARRFVDNGEYPVAITQCRKALDILAVSTRQEVPASDGVEEVLEAIVGPDRAKAYAAVHRAVKKLGNVELHQIVEHGYSRTEALFAVRTAELLTQLFGSLLADRRERPE